MSSQIRAHRFPRSLTGIACPAQDHTGNSSLHYIKVVSVDLDVVLLRVTYRAGHRALTGDEPFSLRLKICSDTIMLAFQLVS
jgi:hypothetical protein